LGTVGLPFQKRQRKTFVRKGGGPCTLYSEEIWASYYLHNSRMAMKNAAVENPNKGLLKAKS